MYDDDFIKADLCDVSLNELFNPEMYTIMVYFLLVLWNIICCKHK